MDNLLALGYQTRLCLNWDAKSQVKSTLHTSESREHFSHHSGAISSSQMVALHDGLWPISRDSDNKGMGPSWLYNQKKIIRNLLLLSTNMAGMYSPKNKEYSSVFITLDVQDLILISQGLLNFSSKWPLSSFWQVQSPAQDSKL